MAVKQFRGDIMLFPETVAVGHGVNIHGIMGAGIAATIKGKFPYVYDFYKNMCDSMILEGGACFACSPQGSDRYIFNMVTQIAPGRNAKLEYVDLALKNMVKECRRLGIQQVALPQIGAGIGGLNWPDVLDLIEAASELDGSPEFLVVSQFVSGLVPEEIV